jgi:predicted hotdog family 3-hydroxylacyl-ACP dehydratase
MGGLAFLELIPHRPPMVLVDSVIEYGPQRITARRTVRQGEPFVNPDGLEDAALLEVIAQTIAAGDALYARSKKGRVLRGYLTGMTGVAVHSRARIGETIEVSADCLKRMDGMGLFEARAEAAGRLLAEGRFKLFVHISYAESDVPRNA